MIGMQRNGLRTSKWSSPVTIKVGVATEGQLEKLVVVWVPAPVDDVDLYDLGDEECGFRDE